MFLTTECPYHAPCGFCVKFDKPCKEVCGLGKKPKPDVNPAKLVSAPKIETVTGYSG